MLQFPKATKVDVCVQFDIFFLVQLLLFTHNNVFNFAIDSVNA